MEVFLPAERAERPPSDRILVQYGQHRLTRVVRTEDRRDRWQERTLDTYRRLLKRYIEVPHLVRHHLADENLDQSLKTWGYEGVELDVDLMLFAAPEVREAHRRSRSALDEWEEETRRRGDENLRLPLEQRESIVTISNNVFREVVTPHLEELAAAMSRELGIDKFRV